MAKQKFMHVQAKPQIFTSFKNIDVFEIMSAPTSTTIGTGEAERELWSYPCKPTAEHNIKECETKGLLPTFNSFDGTLQIGDRGCVTIEKINNVDRYIFNKAGAQIETDLRAK